MIVQFTNAFSVLKQSLQIAAGSPGDSVGARTNQKGEEEGIHREKTPQHKELPTAGENLLLLYIIEFEQFEDRKHCRILSLYFSIYLSFFLHTFEIIFNHNMK